MLDFKKEKVSLRKTALITGIALFMIGLCAAFSVGFVHSNLIIEGDTAATLNAIKKSILLFRAGIFGWLIILICNIVISWGLYVLLKPIDGSLSLLGGLFRLAYSAVLGTAILNLAFISILLSHHPLLTYPDTQLSFMMVLFVTGFEKMWAFGLVIFGIHLFVIGLIIIKFIIWLQNSPNYSSMNSSRSLILLLYIGSS